MAWHSKGPDFHVSTTKGRMYRGRRAASVVKRTGCSASQRLWIPLSALTQWLTALMMLVPESLALYWSLKAPGSHAMHMQTCRQNICAQRRKIKTKKKKPETTNKQQQNPARAYLGLSLKMLIAWNLVPTLSWIWILLICFLPFLFLVPFYYLPANLCLPRFWLFFFSTLQLITPDGWLLGVFQANKAGRK